MPKTSPGGSLVPVDNARLALNSRYPIRRHKTTIGRSTDCDVHIPDASVSRLHAELTWTENGLTLFHHSTTSPTYLNGVPVVESAVVSSGDLIEVGDGFAMHAQLFESSDTDTSPTPATQRRLLTVLSADVAGYSRLMEADEGRTQRLLESTHQIFRNKTNDSGGRVIQMVGDSVLAIYSSVASGLNCALAIQQAIAELNSDLPTEQQMFFRIGIHSGDIYIKPEGRIYGDVINIAARLQSAGAPGRIVASDTVRGQVEQDSTFKFELIGPQKMKNISREIQAYWANAN